MAEPELFTPAYNALTSHTIKQTDNMVPSSPVTKHCCLLTFMSGFLYLRAHRVY